MMISLDELYRLGKESQTKIGFVSDALMDSIRTAEKAQRDMNGNNLIAIVMNFDGDFDIVETTGDEITYTYLHGLPTLTLARRVYNAMMMVYHEGYNEGNAAAWELAESGHKRGRDNV